MKVFVAGIKRGHGIGKDSKKPYDMINLLTLTPLKTGAMGAMTVEGFGFEIMELRVASPALVAQCSTIKFPCVLEIETDVQAEFGEYKTTCVGIVAPVAKAA